MVSLMVSVVTMASAAATLLAVSVGMVRVGRTARARLELLSVLAQHQSEGHVLEREGRGGELRHARRREDLARVRVRVRVRVGVRVRVRVRA